MEAILAAIGDGLCVVDTDFKVIYQNAVHRDMFGDSIGKHCYLVTRMRDHVCEDCPMNLAFSDGGVHTKTMHIPPRNGVTHVDITTSPLRDSSGEIIAGIKITRDVTLVRKTEGAIKEANNRFSAILHASPSAIVTMNRNGVITLWNKTAEQLFGWTEGEAIGKRHPIVSAAHNDEFQRILERVIGGESISGLEVQRNKKDGSAIDISISAAPLRDSKGKINELIAFITDITKRKQMEKQLYALSITDELTGLYNRRGFFTLAEQQLKIAHREKKAAYLLFIDIDDLKKVNDTFGHNQGDILLIEASNIFKEVFRESDIIARVGGDEFAVFPVGCDRKSAGTVIDRLQNKIKAYNTGKLRDYKFSMSTGVSAYDPASPCSLDDMLAEADRLMYKQKRKNKELQS